MGGIHVRTIHRYWLFCYKILLKILIFNDGIPRWDWQQADIGLCLGLPGYLRFKKKTHTQNASAAHAFTFTWISKNTQEIDNKNDILKI